MSLPLPPTFDQFRHLWLVDTEFIPVRGEPPTPVCLVAHELRSGRTLALWEDDLRRLPRAPYQLGPSSLFIAYAAQAEFSVHLALGWDLPTCVLDLYAEFRCYTNGLMLDHGNSLIGALAHFNLPAMGAGEKDTMRKRIMRGGPWDGDDRAAILDYCATDVDALTRLLPALAPTFSLKAALLRGRYVRAVAHIERRGIPIDVPLYTQLEASWPTIITALTAHWSPRYGHCYNATGTFSHKALLHWADANHIDWPRTPRGLAVLEREALKDLCRTYPHLEDFRQLRKTLGQMRLHDFAVGHDGRCRAPLLPWATKTGRNAPGSRKRKADTGDDVEARTQNLMGAAAWLRGIIQAPPGFALAYVDWAQQEYGIAAVLSGDHGMRDAYLSGDPYIELAKMARAVPAWATKDTHEAARKKYKEVSLGILYGMGARALARKLDIAESEASQLLTDHKRAFPRFWQWSEETVWRATLDQHISTRCHWRLRCVPYYAGRAWDINPRSIANFPMQATGGDLLRVACCLAVETGVDVLMPVHDAVLIESRVEDIQEAVRQMQTCMHEASTALLGGFALASEAKIFSYPDHYDDTRGKGMWKVIRDTVHLESLAAVS